MVMLTSSEEPGCSKSCQSIAYTNVDELVCIENCEHDILHWDDELNGNRLPVMDVPQLQQLSFSERLEIDKPMAVWFKVHVFMCLLKFNCAWLCLMLVFMLL